MSITQNKGDSDAIVNTLKVISLCIYKVQSDENILERSIEKPTDKQIKQVNQKHV